MASTASVLDTSNGGGSVDGEGAGDGKAEEEDVLGSIFLEGIISQRLRFKRMGGRCGEVK